MRVTTTTRARAHIGDPVLVLIPAIALALILILGLTPWVPVAPAAELPADQTADQTAGDEAGSGPPLEGEAAEQFLRTAEVVDMKPIGLGVSRPFKVRLSDGTRTLSAAFKTIDEMDMVRRLSRGRPQRDFRDSYKHEIAAYELDTLLGLGLVPPTVERTLHGERGSLQLWVEGCISESERLKQGRTPPNLTRWNQQMFTVRLLHQLIADTDTANVNNLLVDPTFRLWVIDSSRGFGLNPKLPRPEALRMFKRPLLDRLRSLDLDLLRQHLGPWLSDVQLEALLARRDQILDRAESLIRDQGEDAVLFP